jgi:hypothetical protein
MAQILRRMAEGEERDALTGLITYTRPGVFSLLQKFINPKEKAVFLKGITAKIY